MERTREVIASFDSRTNFDRAVAELLAHQFDRSDLSVLATHQSLDAALPPGDSTWRERLTALSGELKYEGPLVNAGLIAVAAGPVGAIISGLIAASVGGAAIKEFMDEVSAFDDSENFEEALAAGRAILWVSVTTDRKESIARNILSEKGGKNIHVFPAKEV